jgi:hypothetical protein
MSVARDSTPAPMLTPRAPGTLATVFGLDVCADIAVPVLQGGRAGAAGRRLDLSVRSGADASMFGWPAGAELISDELAPDGSVSLRIEAHPAAGYLISGPRYGAHLLAVDGRNVSCAHRDVCDSDWERLLIAQVLPFAALLNGLEVFHSSAVVLDGCAIAFVGPSRSGKSSVALELCSRGASFLADDVLALEREGEVLLGHPGSPVASLDHAEAARRRRCLASDDVVGVNARERLVRMRCATGPAPLAALFFLDRRPDGPSEPRFEPVDDPRLLLAATFNFVFAAPARLQRLLDVCALAAQQRVERIVLGPPVDASELSDAVMRHLGEPA